MAPEFKSSQACTSPSLFPRRIMTDDGHLQFSLLLCQLDRFQVVPAHFVLSPLSVSVYQLFSTQGDSFFTFS
jgi:hypothetical protein